MYSLYQSTCLGNMGLYVELSICPTVRSSTMQLICTGGVCMQSVPNVSTCLKSSCPFFIKRTMSPWVSFVFFLFRVPCPSTSGFVIMTSIAFTIMPLHEHTEKVLFQSVIFAHVYCVRFYQLNWRRQTGKSNTFRCSIILGYIFWYE